MHTPMKTNPYNSNQPLAINRSDRDALLKYNRARARALKHASSAHDALLVMRFEQRLASVYWDSDEPSKPAKAVVEVAEQSRGENVSEERRAAIIRVARAKAKFLKKHGKAHAELTSVNFQKQLLKGSLTSEFAKTLLDSLPPIEIPEVDDAVLDPDWLSREAALFDADWFKELYPNATAATESWDVS
jgi:hypothetical protein